MASDPEGDQRYANQAEADQGKRPHSLVQGAAHASLGLDGEQGGIAAYGALGMG
jgi:hypothetical protein